MKNLLKIFLLILLPFNLVAQQFEIRGVLPWHNFLSGPSAWNEADYEKYLDSCAANNINFIGFHNYTGGGERYVNYVEPMIKIQHKNIVPDAFFDNSGSSRWGYLPMELKDFTAKSREVIKVPHGARYFGSDCSVLSSTKEEHYQCSQDLMRKVLKMAHDRNMQMAMGFEFGVIPPEYFSLSVASDRFFWAGKSNMIPNPVHPTSIEIHKAAIDNILETYPGIDWIWVWLNEHSFMSVDMDEAMSDAVFKAKFDKNATLFPDCKTDVDRFLGVWSLEYILMTNNYLKEKGSKARLILGGWGGGNQLPALLQGLDKVLPTDIVFSCLNPMLGIYPQPDFLKDIAKNRKVWTVPWVEGDHQLWHFQPRVDKMANHVKLAYEQNLSGVLTIHWRTEEIKYNLKAFAHFANNPMSDKTSADLYNEYFTAEMGKAAAKSLTTLFNEMDIKQIDNSLLSPEFYAYSPNWGLLNAENKTLIKEICSRINELLRKERDPKHVSNLEYWLAHFEFELLLNEVSNGLKPVCDIKRNYVVNGTLITANKAEKIYIDLLKLPVERMIDTYASKVRSRGEMGVLSSLNQRVLQEYRELLVFFKEIKDKK